MPDADRWGVRLEREKKRRLEAEAIGERVTRELYAVSRKLAEAQRLAHIGSWEWDLRGDQMAWSDEMFHIFGVEPATFSPTRESFLSLVHEGDRTDVENALEEAVQGLRPIFLEHRIMRGDEVRVVAVRGEVEGDGHARAASLAGTSQDVTDQKEAEEARQKAEVRAIELENLRAIESFKTQFLNTAAHELSTPLTPMKLVVHTLRQNMDDETARKQVDMLSRNLGRLELLVRDILDAGRLESARLGINARQVDLAPLVADVATLYKAAAEGGGIKFEEEIDSGLVIRADADRLGQALNNLLSNAVKFTPAGGSVCIRARRTRAGGVILVVEDTGVGIDPSFRSQMFQPFSRAHLPLDQIQPGTGLGLYITKGIVELHGGTLECHSDGPGKGARFTIVLPP